MINRRFILAAVAGIAFSTVANAAIVTKILGDPNVPGSNSGWTVRYDDAELTVTFLGPPNVQTSSALVVIEKVASFNSGPNDFGFIDPAEITFVQNSGEATEQIIIDREHLFNNTGTTWTGFRFIIEDPMSGVGGGARFDQAASASFNLLFPAGVGFDTKTWLSSDVQEELFASGGPGVADGDEWQPGFGDGNDGGALVINANPFDNGGIRRTFVLKEQPTPGDRVIPLPAAAWTGLSGLIGLGVVSSIKALRRRMA
jgi:hypothetical protein